MEEGYKTGLLCTSLVKWVVGLCRLSIGPGHTSYLMLVEETSSLSHRQSNAPTQYIPAPRVSSVSDPHWFLCGSGSSCLPYCGSKSNRGSQNNVDPDPYLGQTLPLLKVEF
jgi:hypothetical protein